MSTARTVSRRRFLKEVAGTAAIVPTIIPARLLGADAPSNKITSGFIGVGEHGTSWNLAYYLRNQTAKVIAVCDVDENHLRRAKRIVDDRYDNQDCFATKDFREILARKDVDTVMISTPNHWHTLI